MAIKFDSVDATARTATFDIDGELVTRQIAEGVTDDTLEEHIKLLMMGLEIEFTAKPELTFTKLEISKGDTLEDVAAKVELKKASKAVI